MTISLTKAKPYAKAIFDTALAENKIVEWLEILKQFSEIILACEKRDFLDSPLVSVMQKIDFFAIEIERHSEAANLIKLLAERRALSLLPDIFLDFQELFFAHNGILEVTLVSAAKLCAKQKEQLLVALEKRYQREILLHCKIDSQLIGGAILYAEDKVVDVSVKGVLQNLKQNLLL